MFFACFMDRDVVVGIIVDDKYISAPDTSGCHSYKRPGCSHATGALDASELGLSLSVCSNLLFMVDAAVHDV